MGRLSRLLSGGTKLPGVPQARHVAERAVAPYLRDDLAATLAELRLVGAQTDELRAQVHELQRRTDELAEANARLERHQPTILNAISTANGASRLLRRELSQQIAELAELIRTVGAATSEVGPAILTEMSPHVETIAWLLRRVETLRAEMLFELRYGRDDAVAESAPADQPLLSRADGPIRLNIGCGHIPIDGYTNVDMRPLPGVDVVAGVDKLPAESGTVSEIFSAHLLEHFPEEQLRRQLLPYWWSLLEPGGRFRAVVPDSDAMLAAYGSGSIGFDALRRIIFGDQEYEGDFHFNAFTPRSLTDLLEKAGFVDIRVVETGRLNGDCLEAEIEATRPAHRAT